MAPRCFFDTNIVIFDLLQEDSPETYNTDNDDIHPVTSLFVKEEILHKALGEEHSDIYDGGEFEGFHEFWELVENGFGLFDLAHPDARELDRRFSSLLNGLMRDDDIDFEGEYNERLPGGIDLLLLAAADIADCTRFITSDDIRLLGDASISFNSVEQVVIIDKDDLSVDSAVEL